MEENLGIAILLFFVYAILGILSFVLFCKVWGMTNNVKAIREMLEEQQKEKNLPQEKESEQKEN